MPAKKSTAKKTTKKKTATKKRPKKKTARKVTTKTTKPKAGSKPKATQTAQVKEKDLAPIKVPAAIGITSQGNPIFGNPVKFDMRDLVVYAFHVAGLKNQQIAERLGIHRHTVRNRLNRIKDAIADQVDIGQVRDSVLSLFPLAMGSLVHNLTICDPGVTTNYLKGTGIYVDRRDDAPDRDVSDDDLARRILDTVQAVAGPKGTADAGSG